MNQTFRLKCGLCGKSYQTDQKRGQAIALLLQKDPDYLKKYKCRSCIRGGIVASTVVLNALAKSKAVTPKKQRRKTVPKVEEKVETPKQDESINFITDDEILKQHIPTSSEKYINRYFGIGKGKVLDEDVLKFHFTSKDPLLKNVLFIGETGCMPESTLIKTPFGDMPINKVSKVMTYNFDKKQIEEKTAIVHNSGKKELWKIHTNKGIIECSPDHKWLVYRKGSIIEVQTKEIINDDLLVEIKGDKQ